ncbi:MAG: dihydrodipicolinate synthase family protein, partial [Candidatus Binatia bacterium]
MPGFKEFKKVLPAANMPMLADMSIDEETYRKHLRWLMTFDIGGLVISGHAGELESLTPKERIRVFRYGAKTGLMYSVEVLLKIAEKVPQVVAIKDSSFDYESAWVAFQN